MSGRATDSRARASATDLRVRVVPCLDVRDGRVVKGVRFEELRDSGDPAEVAAQYEAEGADELVYLDVGATPDGRPAALEAIERTAAGLFVPLTVGGRVRGAADAERLLRAGADRVAVNSAALEDPTLITDLARRFGSQCVVLAVDAARDPAAAAGRWRVRSEAGRRSWDRDPVAWSREGVERGAGEILATSIDRDGTGEGYDLELVASIASAVSVPVVASGGFGRPEHAAEAAKAGAGAVLVAGSLHRRETTVSEIKAVMSAAGIPVRRAP